MCVSHLFAMGFEIVSSNVCVSRMPLTLSLSHSPPPSHRPSLFLLLIDQLRSVSVYFSHQVKLVQHNLIGSNGSSIFHLIKMMFVYQYQQIVLVICIETCPVHSLSLSVVGSISIALNCVAVQRADKGNQTKCELKWVCAIASIAMMIVIKRVVDHKSHSQVTINCHCIQCLMANYVFRCKFKSD